MIVIRPFANGSQFLDWSDRNCERCVKSFDDMSGVFRCTIQEAIEENQMGGADLTPEIAQRMGYTDPLAYTWDCTEREPA